MALFKPAIAALLLAATAGVSGYPYDEFDQLHEWITVGAHRQPWVKCKLSPYTYSEIRYSDEPKVVPYFRFNGDIVTTAGKPVFSCFQSGPHRWGGNEWFVQVVTNLKPRDCGSLGDCRADNIRVCSPALVKRIEEPVPPIPDRPVGPCKTQERVGNGGCERCTLSTMQAP